MSKSRAIEFVFPWLISAGLGLSTLGCLGEPEPIEPDQEWERMAEVSDSWRGRPCNDRQPLQRCDVHGSRLVLRCEGGRYEPFFTCDVGDACYAHPGPLAGTCRAFDAECVGAGGTNAQPVTVCGRDRQVHVCRDPFRVQVLAEACNPGEL